jgi:serine/threonine-protein kinase
MGVSARSTDRVQTGTMRTSELPPATAGFDETMAPSAVSNAATSLRGSTVRTTVLPRVADAPGGAVVDRLRYEEKRHLGAGGQAQVTLTHDHDIDRVVAVKRLLPDRQDAAAVLRFTEEIRTVGQLEHPNIVPIHDVGVDEQGQYFFVMKYVEGEALDTIIAKLRDGDPAHLSRYTPEHRLQICTEILRVLQHAHALGVVHRDLKPGNVMVGKLGEVSIMDWGLAKRIGEGEPARAEQMSVSTSERVRLFETQAGALLGTPAYMSPEQAAGRLHEVDERSDLYSLAVMFYEFLCLKHPRAHCESVAEMIASACEEPISAGQVFRDFTSAGAPAALAHFVRHGLDRDPARRYPSAAAMLAALEAVRDGRSAIECHITFVQHVLDKLARGTNRAPIFTLVALLATTGLLGLGVVQAVRLFMH